MWPYLPQTKMRSHLCIIALYYPKSVIRLLCANETFFLSFVSSLLGYNGAPLRPQRGETPVQK